MPNVDGVRLMAEGCCISTTLKRLLCDDWGEQIPASLLCSSICPSALEVKVGETPCSSFLHVCGNDATLVHCTSDIKGRLSLVDRGR